MGNNIAHIVDRPRVKHPFISKHLLLSPRLLLSSMAIRYVGSLSNAWVLARLWETYQHAWKEIHARQSTQDLFYF